MATCEPANDSSSPHVRTCSTGPHHHHHSSSITCIFFTFAREKIVMLATMQTGWATEWQHDWRPASAWSGAELMNQKRRAVRATRVSLCTALTRPSDLCQVLVTNQFSHTCSIAFMTPVTFWPLHSGVWAEWQPDRATSDLRGQWPIRRF